MKQLLPKVMTLLVACIGVTVASADPVDLPPADAELYARASALLEASYRDVGPADERGESVQETADALRALLPEEKADLPQRLIDPELSVEDLGSAWQSLAACFSEPDRWFVHVKLIPRVSDGKPGGPIGDRGVVSVLLCPVSKATQHAIDGEIHLKKIVTEHRKTKTYEEFRDQKKEHLLFLPPDQIVRDNEQFEINVVGMWKQFRQLRDAFDDKTIAELELGTRLLLKDARGPEQEEEGKKMVFQLLAVRALRGVDLKDFRRTVAHTEDVSAAISLKDQHHPEMEMAMPYWGDKKDQAALRSIRGMIAGMAFSPYPHISLGLLVHQTTIASGSSEMEQISALRYLRFLISIIRSERENLPKLDFSQENELLGLVAQMIRLSPEELNKIGRKLFEFQTASLYVDGLRQAASSGTPIEPEVADRLIQEAQKHAPDSVYIQNQIARLLWQLDRREESVVYLKRLVDRAKAGRIHSNFQRSAAGEAAYLLAIYFAGHEKFEEATRTISIAATFRPNDSAVFFDAGRLLLRIGKPQGAKAALERSLSLGLRKEDIPKAKRMLKALENLDDTAGNSL